MLNPDRAGTYSYGKAFFIDPITWAILQSVALPDIIITSPTLSLTKTFNTQFRGDYKPFVASLGIDYPL